MPKMTPLRIFCIPERDEAVHLTYPCPTRRSHPQMSHYPNSPSPCPPSSNGLLLLMRPRFEMRIRAIQDHRLLFDVCTVNALESRRSIIQGECVLPSLESSVNPLLPHDTRALTLESNHGLINPLARNVPRSSISINRSG